MHAHGVVGGVVANQVMRVAIAIFYRKTSRISGRYEAGKVYKQLSR